MFPDFTKLECPFVRKRYKINKDHWKEHGSKMGLREPEVYLVTPELNPDYAWVMEHPATFACEKLDGCLHPSTKIVTNRGLIDISKIVLKNMNVEVLSYNINEDTIEYKPITHYHSYKRKGKLFRVSFPRLSGGSTSIVCTGEHKFYRQKEWIKAEDLRAGETVTLLEKREQISYPQQQAIIGIALGDGHIYKSGVTNIKYSLQFSQGIAQTDYFNFKVRLLGSLCRRLSGKYFGGYEGSKEVLRANCTVHPAINDILKRAFFTTEEKKVCSNLITDLDIIGVAFWYMDDGSLCTGNKQQPRAFFAAFRYDDDEADLLCGRLRGLGFDCSVNKTANGNIIGLTKEGSKAFFHTVSPFLHSSMAYKLPPEYRVPSFWDNYKSIDNPLLKESVISSIELVDKYRGFASPNVYDLTVGDNNNYFASDGVLVHNSNVGVLMENGRVKEVQNRKNEVDTLQYIGGRFYIMEGLFTAAGKGLLHRDGLQYGELLGPKLNGNPYKLSMHVWYPFTKARLDLVYKSFTKYPRDFWGWSEWFRTGLKSLYTKKKSTQSGHTEDIPAEGVVFTNRPLGSDEFHPRMAKLRVDMYPWHYWDKIEIYDLEPTWRANQNEL